MKSLRTKITFITMCVVSLAIIVVSSLSVFFIRNTEHRKSDQLLLLLSETGKKNLDYYFNSIQKSVDKVSQYANSNLYGTDDESLEEQSEKLKPYFEDVSSRTNGVLTYYYRIDPEISENVKGFWFTNVDGKGFEEHEVTDITLYDTKDTTKLVWFTVPKNEKKAIWIAPYITENLNKRVLSYNEPIFYRGRFIGVIGIEIDYDRIADQVDGFKLFGNGYAFLSDDKGNLFFHPHIDVTNLSEGETVDAPKGLISENTFITYTYEGVKKEAAWLPLSNGMRLYVTVPVSEMEGDWQRLIINIIIVSLEVLVVSTLFIMLYTRRISKPLKDLTMAAERVENGNYDYTLKYDRNDELGRLTRTFKNLSSRMKENITNLNKQVFVDSLTQVKNKAAFIEYTNNLQKKLEKEDEINFSIGIFDCNDLKKINDLYGHDKGDIYLKTASHAIYSSFQHSPVFRTGGDEFAIILENDDYLNKELLVKKFEKAVIRINTGTEVVWEQVNIAFGITDYDKTCDRNVDEVIRRADKLMYENKRLKKSNQDNKGGQL